MTAFGQVPFAASPAGLLRRGHDRGLAVGGRSWPRGGLGHLGETAVVGARRLAARPPGGPGPAQRRRRAPGRTRAVGLAAEGGRSGRRLPGPFDLLSAAVSRLPPRQALTGAAAAARAGHRAHRLRGRGRDHDLRPVAAAAAGGRGEHLQLALGVVEAGGRRSRSASRAAWSQGVQLGLLLGDHLVAVSNFGATPRPSMTRASCSCRRRSSAASWRPRPCRDPGRRAAPAPRVGGGPRPRPPGLRRRRPRHAARRGRPACPAAGRGRWSPGGRPCGRSPGGVEGGDAEQAEDQPQPLGGDWLEKAASCLCSAKTDARKAPSSIPRTDST